MKFSAVIFAAGASAAAMERQDAVFKVSDFSAGCIPHSTQCSYTFGVLQPGTMEQTPVQCKAMAAADGQGNLPEILDGTCEESSRTFSVTKSAEGLTLVVSQPVSPTSNQSGQHFIPNSELVTSNEPNAVVQSYQGSPNFDLTSQ
ncbi:hypothetical protein DL766_007902 [Monosporascus sp. MC13-8B]|uniref:Hypersensitive response-inducing protein n=1 Tax=Monosporascus cannonballus TaxID=155416 RepID=A0ABY0H8Q6_9PEZI|nr:hypothetical protein DL762_005680 [Monosporascus cannonballus]RYO89444.1 hypothetical protein DL763_005657 [Monosporascus cannonballus]RYP21596.1 hypothetical protein DL766_007902 [Monosporascus sp. MC13-8B]